MTLETKTDHFQGKSVADHLREARTKGAIAAGEVHGMEMPAHLSSFTSSIKEMAVLLALLGGILSQFSMGNIFSTLALFAIGYVIWKSLCSAYLGWARLERLHRLMEQERFEIENNREEEKKELTALYQAKGFSGKLLEQVIDVLMADDSRLLRVMLEEEMGLTLETYEHPLRQAAGAALGGTLSASIILFGFWMGGIYGLGVLGLLISAFALFASALLFKASKEKNRSLSSVVWGLSIGILSVALAIGIARFTV